MAVAKQTISDHLKAMGKTQKCGKWRKSWVNLGQPSTSTAKTDRFGKKAMLCVWWDQKGVVYHELLKPGETVNIID